MCTTTIVNYWKELKDAKCKRLIKIFNKRNIQLFTEKENAQDSRE